MNGKPEMEIQREIDYYATDSATAQMIATLNGGQVVTPQPNQLFIDIDSTEDRAAFGLMLGLLQQFEEAAVVYDKPSPSGKPGHSHVIVELTHPVTNEQRIMLQAALGTDRKATFFQAMRIQANDPTLFFEL